MFQYFIEISVTKNRNFIIHEIIFHKNRKKKKRFAKRNDHSERKLDIIQQVFKRDIDSKYQSEGDIARKRVIQFDNQDIYSRSHFSHLKKSLSIDLITQPR